MFLLAQFTLANGFSGFNYSNIHSSRYEVCIKQFLALLQAKKPKKYGARAQKRKTILRDEDSEIPDADEADASIPDGFTNPDGTTIPDAPVTPDAANAITVDENFSSTVGKKKGNSFYSFGYTRPGTQSVSAIHEVKDVHSVAAAQGAIPAKAANPDENVTPDKAANPDEGATPDKGATPDEESNPDKEATPDASPAAQVATQEPLTQSHKEGQATQEPPTQREGESLTEAGSGKFSYLPSFISRLSARMNTSETFKKIPPLV